MTCDEARRLIHLWRQEEMTEHEAEALNEHCAVCPTCAGELDQALEAATILNRMRKYTPAPRDPERLTQAILRRTTGMAKDTVSQPGVIERFFAVPAFRYAAALLLVLTGVSFVGQQILIMRDVSLMEERFARSEQIHLSFAYIVHPEALTKLRESRELRALSSLQIPTTAGEQLLVTQQTALALQQYLSERSAIPAPSVAPTRLDSLVRLIRPDVTPTLHLK